MEASWTIKYRPNTLSDIVNNREAVKKFVDWLKAWSRKPPKKRAALLYGPPGVGKTVCVEAASKDLGYELIETNASDYRTADVIERVAGLASQYRPFFGKGRIVLLDEVDGLHGTVDKGGVKAIISIVKKTRCPIVFTANDPYDKRFSSLRKICQLIQFKKLTIKDVTSLLKKICLREGIEADEEALRLIAERSTGDLRSAVNDLQALAQGKKRLRYEDVAWLASRDRKEEIFQVLNLIFNSKTCEEAKRAIDRSAVDMDMLFEWVYENIPYQMRTPEELVKAMDAIALADVYRARIRKTGNWKFLRYVIDFMTAGIATAKNKLLRRPWAPFKYPGRIRSLAITRSNRQMRAKISMKVKAKCHVSSAVAERDFLPFLKIIFQSDKETASRIAEWLGLEEEEVNYLSEGGS